MVVSQNTKCVDLPTTHEDSCKKLSLILGNPHMGYSYLGGPGTYPSSLNPAGSLAEALAYWGKIGLLSWGCMPLAWLSKQRKGLYRV